MVQSTLWMGGLAQEWLLEMIKASSFEPSARSASFSVKIFSNIELPLPQMKRLRDKIYKRLPRPCSIRTQWPIAYENMQFFFVRNGSWNSRASETTSGHPSTGLKPFRKVPISEALETARSAAICAVGTTALAAGPCFSLVENKWKVHPKVALVPVFLHAGTFGMDGSLRRSFSTGR